MKEEKMNASGRKEGPASAGRRQVLAALGTAGVGLLAANTLALLPDKASAAPVPTVYNVKDYGALGDGVTDDTTAINDAITAASAAGGGKVYIPEGLYLVDPSVSLVLKKGVWISGDGEDATVLTAKPVGGSVFRRTINPSGPNPYLQDLFIGHLSVVLNHPATAAPGNYEQIGFDFRHITRSTIFECYVGNYARGSLVKPETPIFGDWAQGYGIVFGNVSSSDPAYCGGEVNTVMNCAVWGARKAIIMDDSALSPASAAHATRIENCDIQICEVGIGNESRYTAGLLITNNVVQQVIKQTGSTRDTYCYRIEGYGCKVDAGYIESMLGTNYVIYLGAQSRINRVFLNYYSSSGTVNDFGTHNYVQYLEQTTGSLTTTYNQVPDQRAWVTFDSTGTIVDGSGVASVVHVGPGDYLVNWLSAFASSPYQLSYSCIVDASGSAGLVITRSISTANARLHTYEVQHGGTVTQKNFSSVTVLASAF